ncbi:MAG: sensor histidine kinase [Deltaproteobacteria bacterium]|nr:sensor histidine kinase [Deltaproteobacteria bacterium]
MSISAPSQPRAPFQPKTAPEQKSLRWTLPVAFGVTVTVAAVFSSQTYLEMIDHGHDWWRLFLWQLGSWWFWALVASAVMKSGGRLLRPEERPRLWPLRETLKGVALTALHIPVVAVVFFALQPFEPVATYPLATSMLRAYITWSRIDPLIYFMLLVVGYGLAAYREAREAELRESQLQTALAEAELEALRLQIQPHFLFNTLNSIAALVRRQSNDRALEMILGLSELLRTALQGSSRQTVPLSEELRLVERYLDIQKARFSDRLQVLWQIEEDAKSFPVPVFILQPLVENAILHGLAKSKDPGSLTLSARRHGEFLTLRIEDDGEGLPTGFDLDSTSGVGLQNIRARLDQLYGPVSQKQENPQETQPKQLSSWLTLHRRPEGGTVAQIFLPGQPPSALAAKEVP